MRTGELRDVRERHRLLLTPAAEGGGLAALLAAVATDTGLSCWVVTGTGRVIAGAGELTRSAALRLAVRYQRGDVQADDEDGPFTLVPVGGDRPSVTEWFLACAGRERDWSPAASRALAGLEADAVTERVRQAALRAGERGLAEAVIGRLAAGAGDGAGEAHTETLLRAAGLHPGYLAVAFATDGAAGGEPDRELAEELLGNYAGRVAAAVAEDEILAVLSVGGAPDGRGLAAWLREAAPVLRAAGIRLTMGLSAPVPGAAGLAGALRESSAARRAVEVRPDDPDPVVIATSSEVDSHDLLLASVPAAVLRSFRDRLLGPLIDYDARHRAELLPTLRSFLACDGSWSVCAAQMYVHVNTVRYRIGRIESLTGRNLSTLPDRVDFFLALRGT